MPICTMWSRSRRARAPGGADVIWEPDDLPLVGPGATTTITARFDTAAYSISGLQFEAADDGGNNQTVNVAITPTYYAQRADLVVVNSSNVRVRLYPLRVIGQPLVGGPEIEERRSAATAAINPSSARAATGRWRCAAMPTCRHARARRWRSTCSTAASSRG